MFEQRYHKFWLQKQLLTLYLCRKADNCFLSSYLAEFRFSIVINFIIKKEIELMLGWFVQITHKQHQIEMISYQPT